MHVCLWALGAANATPVNECVGQRGLDEVLCVLPVPAQPVGDALKNGSLGEGELPELFVV